MTNFLTGIPGNFMNACSGVKDTLTLAVDKFSKTPL